MSRGYHWYLPDTAWHTSGVPPSPLQASLFNSPPAQTSPIWRKKYVTYIHIFNQYSNIQNHLTWMIQMSGISKLGRKIQDTHPDEGLFCHIQAASACYSIFVHTEFGQDTWEHPLYVDTSYPHPHGPILKYLILLKRYSFSFWLL